MALHPRWQRRSVSLRWSLFKNLLLLIVLISGSLVVYSLINSRRTIRYLSLSVIEEASRKAEDKLARFFAPISKAIEIVRVQGDLGLISPDAPVNANRLLIPVLAAIPQMSSINTGKANGEAFLLVRRKGAWLNVTTRGDLGSATWQQVDEKGRVLNSWTQPLDFDPRARPWYNPALEAVDRGIHWTEPYGFIPTNDPGITASVRVEGPDGPYVLAFDILLEDLSRLAESINVSANGKTFVLAADDRLLIPPAMPGGATRAMLLKPVEKVALPLLGEGVRAWRKQTAAGPFQIKHEGQTWWCGFEPYHLGSDRRFWIGVLIPESDLLGEHRHDTLVLLVLTALALVVATLMTLLLARSYSKPLGKLVEESGRLQRLQTDAPLLVDSPLREVQMLADAHEKMRRALDSFARYVPVTVVRELLDRGEAAAIGGREAEVTVLFTDIVGFTAVAESMSAADLTEHMSVYFDAVIAILQRSDATVDKLMGDAVMAFWGAPHDVPDRSRKAVEAVLEIRAWLAKANQRWAAHGLPPLPTRFGLAAGEVTVGNMGAHDRLSYTALGDTVNLAKRLEALNCELGTWVLVDETVRAEAGADFAWRDMGTVEVKGRKVPTRIFELRGRK